MLLLSLKKDEIRDEKWWRSTPVTSVHIQERLEDFCRSRAWTEFKWLRYPHLNQPPQVHLQQLPKPPWLREKKCVISLNSVKLGCRFQGSQQHTSPGEHEQFIVSVQTNWAFTRWRSGQRAPSAQFRRSEAEDKREIQRPWEVSWRLWKILSWVQKSWWKWTRHQEILKQGKIVCRVQAPWCWWEFLSNVKTALFFNAFFFNLFCYYCKATLHYHGQFLDVVILIKSELITAFLLYRCQAIWLRFHASQRCYQGTR